MARDHLDWPFFDDAHRDLAARLDDWAAREIAPLDGAHDDIDGQCRRLVAMLGEAGWLRWAVPASHGGAHERLDVRCLCLIREILARHNTLADFVFAMQGLGAGPVTLFGTEAQKAMRLQGVGAGRLIAAFAISEPDAGSDVAAIRTTAMAAGDGYVLNGEKTWISNGGVADFYVVLARTGEAPGARGLSVFLVDAATPGVEIAERIEAIAPHPLARLRFAACRVPASALIGEAGAGFKVAMATLDVFRSTVGAAALGMARRALAATLDHVAARSMFGAKLADLPLAQAKIAAMASDVDAAALLVYRAAWTKDRGAARVTREAAMAKMFATEAAQRVIDAAVQLHGGEGVRSGAVTERLYREIRALRIYEGATEVQQLVIARQTLEAHRIDAQEGSK